MVLRLSSVGCEVGVSWLLWVAVLGCASPPTTGEVTTWRDPVAGIELVSLSAGTFVMGSPRSEPGHEEQEAAHRVTLSPFWIGRTEVTQRQWLEVMGNSPSHFQECGGDCPVENVSLLEVEELLARLRERTGRAYRLPTEAEWEYACRAGTTTPFSTGQNLTTDVANYDGRYPYASFPAGEYREMPTPVASFAPNPWGLFDLHGNVWEWCRDRHCPYQVAAGEPESALTDPLGACESELRIIRGGSWYFNADSARCAVRYTHRPQDRGPSLGLRLALDADEFLPGGAR